MTALHRLLVAITGQPDTMATPAQTLHQGRDATNPVASVSMFAGKPTARRAVVPVTIYCYRTSLLRRAGWFVADFWAFLTAPRFR
jgi:hypothetical protein